MRHFDSKRALLRELAAWAVDVDSIPPDVEHAGRRLLMDQVGVSVAGGKSLGALAHGAPLATLWATGDSVYAPDAALANRFAGDDLELTAGPEIGAAGVAAAEVVDATLSELLVAMAVAAELEHHLRGWLQLAVERHGLHPPAVFGAFAATAVASKLSRLETDAFTGALAAGLALTPQSPYAAFSEGATGKWLYGAWSQKLGLECALWARTGMTGALSTLEGSRGVAQAFLHEMSPAPEFRPDGWAITAVTFKPFPCSRACHAALTAVEELGEIAPDAIERVEIWSYPFSVDLEEKSTKANAIASQMSLSAMLRKRLRTNAPTTVSREGSEELPRVRKARIRVTMKNGDVREAASEAKWSASAPATDEELRARFLESTKSRPIFDPWEVPGTVRVREMFRG